MFTLPFSGGRDDVTTTPRHSLPSDFEKAHSAQVPFGPNGETSPGQRDHNRFRGAKLFAATLAVAVASAGMGGVTALTVYPHAPAWSTVATAAASQPADSIEQVAARVLPSVVQLQTDLRAIRLIWARASS
jgi:putative serine protease PepD